MVEPKKIRKWVEIVNKEYGLSDKNETSIKFFESINKVLDCIECDDYFICYLVAPDMWGETYLSIACWYIMPDKRNLATFKKVQDEIIKLAKRKKVEYIIQGSHLNDKLHRVLGKMGYKVASMRRNI